MNEWIQLILMAVLQGVTEFLPVSSSGHLVILGNLCGLNPETNLSLGIFMHTGSFFAILLFYFKLLLGFFRKDQLHLMLMVIVGTIPAGIAGVLIKKAGLGGEILENPLITGMAFLVTGMLLRLTAKEKLLPDQEKAVTVKEINLKQALIVGLVQMGAILPGISRSGSTIAAGLFCGIKREDAAAFSFLLALPAIGGATLLEVIDLASAQGGTSLAAYSIAQILTAMFVSFATSLGALLAVVSVVKKSKLSLFSWYLFALGIIVLIWQFSLLNGAK